MTYRGGFDVIDLHYIKETVFGTTPTSGTWLPVWRMLNFDPRYIPVYVEGVGLGSQVVTSFTPVKEYAEFSGEHYVLKRQATPAFNWKDFFAYIVAAGQGGTPTNEIDSFSLGARLDLPTDEFWHLRGCKLNSYELRGDSIEDLVTGRFAGIGQIATYGTTDYVSGTATRQANPTTDPVHFGECDLLIGGTSIYPSLINWSLTFARTIERKGTHPTTRTLYSALVCRAREYNLEITKDFESTAELSAFIGKTDISATLRIPSASGGVSIALGGGKWLSAEVPKRELELLNLTLRARFRTLTVSDIP